MLITLVRLTPVYQLTNIVRLINIWLLPFAVAILQIGNQPTDGELATALRVSPRALRDYRNEGILPYIRMKGNILYRESDVERVLRRCIRGKMTLQSG